MPSVAPAGLPAIILTAIILAGACSAPASPAVGASDGAGMSDPIGFTCTPGAGAEIEDADRICGELLASINQTRPDLRFVIGRSGAPAAVFVITRGDARGLGLEATWIDAQGVRTIGKPLSVTFFDRPSDPVTRSNFYAAFLRDNPIPF